MDYHHERTDWGGIMARALVATVPSTVSPTPYEKPRPVEWPTTIEEANALREWASSTPAAPAASATSDQLAKHLEFMHAALPSRANDTETGRKRFAVYASILAGKSNEALAFMARRACETLDWFPTPKQCLDLLGQYQPPMPAQEQALLVCRQFTHSAFEDWLHEVRGGAQIGDVPEHWKRIAVEQGDVRRLEDGSYVSRAAYHGPACRPYRPIPPRATVARPAPMPPGVAGASAGLL